MRLTEGVRRWLRRHAVRPVHCGACGEPKGVGRRMISGPGVYLCEPCVRDAAASLVDSAAGAAAPARCRFCGQTQPPARLAQARAPLPVCVACVRLMDGILTEDDARSGPAA